MVEDIAHFVGISSSDYQAVSSVRAPESFEFGLGADPKKATWGKKKRKSPKKNTEGGRTREKAHPGEYPPGKKGPRLRDSERSENSIHKKKRRREGREEGRKNTYPRGKY